MHSLVSSFVMFLRISQTMLGRFEFFRSMWHSYICVTRYMCDFLYLGSEAQNNIFSNTKEAALKTHKPVS